jgi:hypothetical protein
MKIDFDAETADGIISFHGDLTKEEVDFLLRFALLSMMARGIIPLNDASFQIPEPSPTVN